MKPHPIDNHRTFDVDKYLDDHKDAPQSAQFPGLHPQSKPEERSFRTLQTEQPFTFRGWAVRLNAWILRCQQHVYGWPGMLNDAIERLLDRTDWPRIDIWLGTVGGFAITGVVVWFIWVLADAWIQGRFSLGGN